MRDLLRVGVEGRWELLACLAVLRGAEGDMDVARIY